MKKLKTWQKAGLITALVGGLTLGGYTIKKNSGLEGKLISIGMSTANAMEVNPEGYEVPDLTGIEPDATDYSETEKGLVFKIEAFKSEDWITGLGQSIYRFSRDGKIFGYFITKSFKVPYFIIDNDGDGIFESKYGAKEAFPMPKWVE